jgi:protein-disulfide isomerase
LIAWLASLGRAAHADDMALIRFRTFRTAACGFLFLGLVWQRVAADTAPQASRSGATFESLEKQIAELREGQRILMEELRQLRLEIQGSAPRKDVIPAEEPKPFVTLNVRGEPLRGSTNARVAVVVFSDFNCSHCAEFEREIYPKLEEQYLRTGKVRLLFRDLPDRNDADALAKSEAARCAGEQGRFWDMHDVLYLDQSPYSVESSAKWISATGIEAEPFRACMESHRYRDPIRRSIALADRMGIRGTPTFLIGTCDDSGIVIRSEEIFTGVEPIKKFQAILDRLLKQTSGN